MKSKSQCEMFDIDNLKSYIIDLSYNKEDNLNYTKKLNNRGLDLLKLPELILQLYGFNKEDEISEILSHNIFFYKYSLLLFSIQAENPVLFETKVDKLISQLNFIKLIYSNKYSIFLFIYELIF